MDSVREYYATRYTPSRTIVSIVGDLDPSYVVDFASGLYGAWQRKGPDVEGSPAEQMPPDPSLRVLEGDVKRGLATVGWRTVGVHDPDVYALDLAATVLGSGRGSWLSREVRIPGLAASVSAQHYTPTEVGVFDVFLEGDVTRLDDAIERAVELVTGMGSQDVPPAELERAKTLLGTRWGRRMESMDGRAALFCEFEALGGVHLVDSWYARLMNVTAAELQRAVSRYLKSDTPSAVVYLPDGSSTRHSLAPWPSTRAGKVVTPVVVPYIAPRNAGPAGSPTEKRFPGDISHLALNGADLLIRPKRRSGLLFIGVYAPGLRDLEQPDTAGLSTLLVRSALRGAAGMTAEELAESAERLGGTIVPTVVSGAVGWGIMVQGDRDGGTRAASLLRAVAEDATLTSEHIELERSILETDAARAKDDMYRYPLRRVLEVGLPGSANGVPVLGEPEQVRALTDGQVRDWAAELRSRRLTVVAVGDLPHEAMLEVLAPLADWSGVGEGIAAPVSPWVPARVAEERDKAQTALVMAFPSGAYGSDDRFPMIVTSSLLSGLAGRLFESLREQRSLAYTVVASPWLRRTVGAMLTYIATSPEREDEARDEMLRELGRVATEPILEDELERARNYAAGTIQLRLQSSYAVAGEILDAWIHGDLEGMAESHSRLQSVTADDLRSLAERVFASEMRTEFVVRGRRAPS